MPNRIAEPATARDVAIAEEQDYLDATLERRTEILQFLNTHEAY